MWRDDRARELWPDRELVYFADPMPDHHPIKPGVVKRRCGHCNRALLYPATHFTGLPVHARCYCGHAFPITVSPFTKPKEQPMSKQEVAGKVALKLDRVVKELMAEAGDLAPADIIVQADAAKRIAQMAQWFRLWKDGDENGKERGWTR